MGHVGVGLWSRQEVARIASVSDATVDNWRLRGKIEGRKIGNRWYYERSNILKAIAEREIVKAVPIDWSREEVDHE
jgi:hypothetical protein